MRKFKWLVFLAAWAVVLLVTACGGGGGGNGGGPVTPQAELSDILSAEELALLTPAEQEEAANLSGEALNDRGQTLLAAEDILKAKVYFKLAAYRFENQTSNEADTARFFYGLTRVLALPYDSASDPYTSAAAVGYDGSLLDFGDLLDAFGYPANPVDGVDPRAPENLDVDLCPLPLPANSPSGAQIQAFMDDVAMTEIEGGLASLEDVSPSFNTAWTDPYSGVTAESDYGDVLAMRAALKAATSLIMILNAQNLDVDIDAEVNLPEENSVEAYLARNQEFFTPIAGSVLMQSARAPLLEAADDALSAINFMVAETDPQTDDWINLSDSTSDEIEEAKSVITAARDSLRDGTNYTIIPDNQEYQPSVIDPAEFFSNHDFRYFLPEFEGDQPTGLLNDPTFGGVLVSYEGQDPSVLNTDLDRRGTADFFEDSPEIESARLVPGSAGDIEIEWSDTDDAEFYVVMRDTIPILPGNTTRAIVYSGANSYYIDSVLEPGIYYYRVLAMLDSENVEYLVSNEAVVVVEAITMP